MMIQRMRVLIELSRIEIVRAGNDDPAHEGINRTK